MAEEIKIVDLMAKNPTSKKVDILVPYNEIELTGGLVGGGHTKSNGKIELNGKPSGTVKLDGFTHGEAQFDNDGNLDVDTTYGGWVTEVGYIMVGGKKVQNEEILNFFRRVE